MEYHIISSGKLVAKYKTKAEAEKRIITYKQVMPMMQFEIVEVNDEPNIANEAPNEAIEQPKQETNTNQASLTEALKQQETPNKKYALFREDGEQHKASDNLEELIEEAKKLNDTILMIQDMDTLEVVWKVDKSFKKPINNYYVETQDGQVVDGPYDFDNWQEAENKKNELEKETGKNHFVRTEHLGFEKSIEEQEAEDDEIKHFNCQKCGILMSSAKVKDYCPVCEEAIAKKKHDLEKSKKMLKCYKCNIEFESYFDNDYCPHCHQEKCYETKPKNYVWYVESDTTHNRISQYFLDENEAFNYGDGTPIRVDIDQPNKRYVLAYKDGINYVFKEYDDKSSISRFCKKNNIILEFVFDWKESRIIEQTLASNQEEPKEDVNSSKIDELIKTLQEVNADQINEQIGSIKDREPTKAEQIGMKVIELFNELYNLMKANEH